MNLHCQLAQQRTANSTSVAHSISARDALIHTKQKTDGMIWCRVQNATYPQIHSHILHPCVSGSQQSIDCGGFFAATSILRFDSFFTQKRVVVSLTFEVCATSSQHPAPCLQISGFTVAANRSLVHQLL